MSSGNQSGSWEIRAVGCSRSHRKGRVSGVGQGGGINTCMPNYYITENWFGFGSRGDHVHFERAVELGDLHP